MPAKLRRRHQFTVRWNDGELDLIRKAAGSTQLPVFVRSAALAASGFRNGRTPAKRAR
jgi:hypothetical protein